MPIRSEGHQALHVLNVLHHEMPDLRTHLKEQHGGRASGEQQRGAGDQKNEREYDARAEATGGPENHSRSALMTNPTPRTVWSRRRANGSSSLRRSLAM